MDIDNDDTTPSSDEDESKEYACLVRSVCGKSKCTTLVEPRDTEKFQEACGNVMRLHMDSLKKKEKGRKGGDSGGGGVVKGGGRGGGGERASAAGEGRLKAVKKRGTMKEFRSYKLENIHDMHWNIPNNIE
ncbi:hypothetical protein HDU67_009618 [Dinochytrium kinnereticum]|nr:hypothetical protein HDU67_009618 [Dinochytrium kinnereticum]